MEQFSIWPGILGFTPSSQHGFVIRTWPVISPAQLDPDASMQQFVWPEK